MGMFQNFMLKQMLKSKMKGVPQAEQERIIGLVEKNPDFFKKIGEEIQARVKSGQKEMEATMEVMRKHQTELQKLVQ